MKLIFHKTYKEITDMTTDMVINHNFVKALYKNVNLNWKFDYTSTHISEINTYRMQLSYSGNRISVMKTRKTKTQFVTQNSFSYMILNILLN